MKVIGYNPAVMAVMNEVPREGIVHSKFASSVNLQFGERLVNLANEEHGKLPFGVLVNEKELPLLIHAISLGDFVYWNPLTEELSFRLSGHVLEFKEGNRFAQKPRVTTFDLDRIKRNTGKLINLLVDENRSNGFGGSMEDTILAIFGNFARNSSCDSFPPSSSFAESIQQLKLAFVSRNNNLMQEILRFFIGRGPGLTPSGDDLLIGFLVALVYGRKDTDWFISCMEELIFSSGRLLTTRVSEEYLYYAARKQFGSHILELCDAIFFERFDDVDLALQKALKVGHTSGMDTIIGILSGLSLILGADMK
ncbi:DUF2877 domain-containing protein [Fodinisporobacter ferrooxydans]|uniref:DUF2877 domain-containing protein n=1 Tax=Fodinisporobacter ferrooxydans TaxID=2901836 RepID=A0ABY4CQ25_9BACL|nr:DUF2877 domain-containing protein [Alicyclobacillaceae bacterium MYW30-H2]